MNPESCSFTLHHGPETGTLIEPGLGQQAQDPPVSIPSKEEVPGTHVATPRLFCEFWACVSQM